MTGFKIKDLTVLAYGNGFTLWHYVSEDTLADITAKPGYFDNDAAGMFRVGDMILIGTVITGECSQTTVRGGMIMVSDISEKTVSVADMLGPQAA